MENEPAIKRVNNSVKAGSSTVIFYRSNMLIIHNTAQFGLSHPMKIKRNTIEIEMAEDFGISKFINNDKSDEEL